MTSPHGVHVTSYRGPAIYTESLQHALFSVCTCTLNVDSKQSCVPHKLTKYTGRQDNMTGGLLQWRQFWWVHCQNSMTNNGSWISNTRENMWEGHAGQLDWLFFYTVVMTVWQAVNSQVGRDHGIGKPNGKHIHNSIHTHSHITHLMEPRPECWQVDV